MQEEHHVRLTNVAGRELPQMIVLQAEVGAGIAQATADVTELYALGMLQIAHVKLGHQVTQKRGIGDCRLSMKWEVGKL